MSAKALAMELTVKRLSKLAGVSVRTLHFYDEIGLLRPGRGGGNGYRYYGQAAVLGPQQILFYKELGLSPGEIAEGVGPTGVDVGQGLACHQSAPPEGVGRVRPP